METSESWNFCHLVLDYSHKADNTARKWDRTRVEGDLYSPPTGRSENCTYLSKWRAYLSHINHCCNWNREKAFEMLNKTFFNGVRCHSLLFIVGVYSVIYFQFMRQFMHEGNGFKSDRNWSLLKLYYAQAPKQAANHAMCPLAAGGHLEVGLSLKQWRYSLQK